MAASNFVWSAEADAAFAEIKQLVCRDTILAYPDSLAMLFVDRDASDDGLGAVLSQIDSSGIERPLAFASRSLAEKERKWTVMKR